MKHFHLKRDNFYLGAILTGILRYNPGVTLSLLRSRDKIIRAYRVRTQTGQECIISFKTACEKAPGSRSWLCRITPEDRELVSECDRLRVALLLYVLCPAPNIYNSEIAVLRGDELRENLYKKNFTLSIDKEQPARRGFHLHRVDSVQKNVYLPKNRIKQNLDSLIHDVISVSNGYLQSSFPKDWSVNGLYTDSPDESD